MGHAYNGVKRTISSKPMFWARYSRELLKWPASGKVLMMETYFESIGHRGRNTELCVKYDPCSYRDRRVPRVNLCKELAARKGEAFW